MILCVERTYESCVVELKSSSEGGGTGSRGGGEWCCLHIWRGEGCTFHIHNIGSYLSQAPIALKYTRRDRRESPRALCIVKTVVRLLLLSLSPSLATGSLYKLQSTVAQLKTLYIWVMEKVHCREK